MMGTMVPETCWADNKFCNKILSVTSSRPFIFHILITKHGETHIKCLCTLIVSIHHEYLWRHCNYMQQNHSWYTGRHLVGQEIPAFQGIRKFISIITTTSHQEVMLIIPIQHTHSHLIPRRFNVILSLHLNTWLRSYLFDFGLLLQFVWISHLPLRSAYPALYLPSRFDETLYSPVVSKIRRVQSTRIVP
jgi:hypothetical protein